MSTALLLIDVQVNMFEPQPVYRGDEVRQVIQQLLQRARAARVPVIFVQNSGEKGAPDEPGTPGWAIHPDLAPAAGETIVEKREDDAFHQTTLPGILAEQGIRRLVVAGMQSELCVDTTCRRAYTLGYEVVLAADGHSTYDGVLPAAQTIAHHNYLLTSYATVAASADILLEAAPVFTLDEPLGVQDVAAIRTGLAEVDIYDRWLAKGDVTPFWPHNHPSRVTDALRRLWDGKFKPHKDVQPAGWELGVARTFMQPLFNLPEFLRKTAALTLTQGIDHLLQSPTNSFAPQIRKLTDQLWCYDAREFRLFYTPRVTEDQHGQKRKYIFLIWLAPALPRDNPFLG